MASYEQSRFRITTWPQDPVRLPRVEFTKAMQYATANGEELVPGGVRRWRGGEPHPGFGELYLEVCEIDLSDEAQVVDFVQRVDCLGVYSPEWVADWDGDYFGLPEAARWGEAVAWLDEGRFVAAEGVAGIAPPILRREGVERLETPGGLVETYEEFCWGAALICDFTTAWRVASDQVPASAARWRSPLWDWAVRGVDRWAWEGRDSALQFLSEGMRAALVPFSPRVYFTWSDEEHDHAGPHGRTSDDIPLFSILCLELFNHICEEATYRVCGNETCRRLFVRQTGRAQHGQHRTRGVKYCSADCARAQAQRQYRRRTRAKSP